MDKREDHPLWEAFVEWLKIEHDLSPHMGKGSYWTSFLAGAEATQPILAKLVAEFDKAPVTVTATFTDRMDNAVERLEELGKRQGEFGDRQGQVTHELNDHTRSLYSLVRRQEQATKRMEKMGLMVTVTENADVTLGGLNKG